MNSTLLPLHQLYFKYINQKIIRDKEQGLFATQLWGNIPCNINEASIQLSKIREKYDRSSSNIELLQKSMKNNLRKLGLLTEDVSSKIDRLSNGVIEVGQQPNYFGGPSSIFNKICYADYLAKYSSAIPLFYVADYDDARAELLNSRIPGFSPLGINLSISVPSEFNHSPIYKIKNPSEEWLSINLYKIEENYKNLLKNTLQYEKCMQNLRQIFTIIRMAYFSTENVSEFSTKIIGSITNFFSECGIPFLMFSFPESRPIFQDGYEFLLVEKNRRKYIEVSNQTVEKIINSGYKPQIGARKDDYVPFYLECPACGIARVELKRVLLNSETGVLEGSCPRCDTKHSYSFNLNKPDLSELIAHLTPRVDSRQIITDSVIPVIAHIVGPNETSYFAEIIPAADVMQIPFPIVMRYSRLFYNTPWIENIQKELQKNELINEPNAVYVVLKKWIKIKNVLDAQSSSLIHKEMQLALVERNKEIEKQISLIDNNINELKEKIKFESDKNAIIKTINDYKKQKQQLLLYHSWAFGAYTLNKFGQEVNWNWIDLAVVTGVDDLLGVYNRFYNELTPNASTFFINT
jgi:hypothetical protein